jgi:hemolysin III
MSRPRRFHLKEPFSGLSHLAGAFLGVAILIALVVLSKGNAWMVTSFAIYGACLIILYTASALYHLLPVGPAATERLRKFDQCAIYLLIAGSYTPVCLIKLRGPWGWSLLSVVWSIALAGILTQLIWRATPVALHVTLYLIMGWLVAVAIHPILHGLGTPAVAWLACGGLFYTIGSVVFATERPRLWPGIFGFHDLWHVFVIAGTAAHFMMMLCIL